MTKATCGSAHNAALAIGEDKIQQVYTWGLGTDNRLGHGGNDNRNVPTKVAYFDSSEVEDVACGYMHTAVLCAGKLFTFGYNEFGQLGTGDKKGRDSPFCVNTKTLTNAGEVRQVACGGYYTVCVCADSNIYSWGDNGSGKLLSLIAY